MQIYVSIIIPILIMNDYKTFLIRFVNTIMAIIDNGEISKTKVFTNLKKSNEILKIKIICYAW